MLLWLCTACLFCTLGFLKLLKQLFSWFSKHWKQTIAVRSLHFFSQVSFSFFFLFSKIKFISPYCVILDIFLSFTFFYFFIHIFCIISNVLHNSLFFLYMFNICFNVREKKKQKKRKKRCEILLSFSSSFYFELDIW